VAWRAIRAGFTVAEVPITFTERTLGESKMTGSIVREAFVKVGVWGLRHRWEQVRDLVAGGSKAAAGSGGRHSA
jgi:dolichol-phosphate mannosyltransferase